VLAIAPVAVINITSADDTQTPMMMAFILRPLAEPVGDNRIAEPIDDDQIIDASGADDKATPVAPGLTPNAKLSDSLAMLDDRSLAKLVDDHESGSLDGKIAIPKRSVS
jgi:hypothetical protein